MPALRIEALAARHQLEGFDCGKPGLNRFLLLHALTNQRANSSRTYVALRGEQVLGFHTLVVGPVSPDLAPERVKKAWRGIRFPRDAPTRLRSVHSTKRQQTDRTRRQEHGQSMGKNAELQLQLHDPRPCSALQTELEQVLQRLRFRIQERQAPPRGAGMSLIAVEQAHWWSGDTDARLPIWIHLELSPQPAGTELTIHASLELAGRTIGPLALALLRSRVVRLCRLSHCPAEQMQELLQRHAKSQRRRVAVLALVALLGVTGVVLSLREGGNTPDQPATPQELNSVVP